VTGPLAVRCQRRRRRMTPNTNTSTTTMISTHNHVDMATSLVGAGQFKLTLLPPTRASNSVTALYSGLLSYRHWATWPLRSHGQPGASPVSDVRPRRPQTGPDRVDQGQEMGYIRRYRAWSIANRPKATNPSATAVRRNFPNGCARIVCSAPSSPCACCRSKVSVA
jgi:hypothetical protein